MTLASLQGHPSLLVFIAAPATSVVDQSSPVWLSTEESLPQQGVQIAGISVDTPEVSAQLRRDLQLSFPLLSIPTSR